MKNLFINTTWVFIFCLLSSVSVKAGEFAVMPGHSLGRVWLGAPHATVRKIWGRPYLIQRDGSYTVEFWRVDKKSKEHFKSAVFRHGRAVQLETSDPRFTTPHGVSVNSNLGYIRKVFGKMRVISFGRDNPDPEIAGHAANYYDSTKRGVAFELNMGYRADLSARAVPHTLFVHRRGYKFINVQGDEVWAAD